jgi:hypothetical protein
MLVKPIVSYSLALVDITGAIYASLDVTGPYYGNPGANPIPNVLNSTQFEKRTYIYVYYMIGC